MKIRNIALASATLAVATGVTVVTLLATRNSAAEISYGEFLQNARSGSIDQAMIARGKVSAVIDGKERFAVIPPGELNLVSELNRAGINLTVKNRD
jgi:hypothetical protein